MEFTRQGWGVVALAATVAALAALVGRPLLLAGTVGVFAWLLARQWQFVRDATRTVEDLSVTQTPARDRASVNDDVSVAFRAELAEPSPLSATITPTPPVGATGVDPEDSQLALAPGTVDAGSAFSLTCGVAGDHEFGSPTVTLRDAAGLFETTVSTAAGPTLTAEPRSPRQVHVGQLGGQIGAFGEHSTRRLGEGIDPAELREYETGDPASRIDWKATARLDTPHVREFEIDTDLQTRLVVDCRESMGEGPAGQRKLDYLRHVALAYLGAVQHNNEAVGLYTVGDEGILDRVPANTGDDHYAQVRRRLVELEPTGRDHESRAGRSPAAARSAATTLAGDDTDFGRTLRPFYEDSETYVQRVSDDPLYSVLKTGRSGRQGPMVTVVFSDDTRPAELRESVTAARRDDDHVIAFLTPSVLFDSGELGDLERAYGRYREFETFRRDLTRNRVSVYEVAAEDRVEAVLNVGRRANR